MQMANFALRKKIDGDNSSITLRVNDPFNTGVFRVRPATGGLMQITERSMGTAPRSHSSRTTASRRASVSRSRRSSSRAAASVEAELRE